MASILLTVSFLLENKERDYFIKPMDAIRLTAEVADNLPSDASGVFKLTDQAVGGCNEI